ncbi:MAG: MG2 domain-containing protein [Methylotetracoccus sp.]
MRALILLLTILIASNAVARPFAQPRTRGTTAVARVESFSPTGSVKGVRQVVVRFSEAMVRFGDTRLGDPLQAECPVGGRGHWADAQNWTYDFDRDLPAGLRCHFSPKPELRTLSGKQVAGEPRYSFDTGGPSVADSLPSDGNGGIDENQIFLLALDAAADRAAIEQHAHCEIEGLQERIGVEVLQADARAAALSSEVRQNYAYFFERFADDDALTQRLVGLKCRRSFPPDTDIRLVWGAGINVGDGPATAEDQTFNFHSRSAFTARFECERVNADAQCVPFLPLRLLFSAQVPADQAAKIRLVAKDGTEYPPRSIDPARAPTVDRVEFTGQWPESARFEIRLPPDLSDDAGRRLDNAAQFPLSVATDEYPPLAKFSGDFGILEANEGGVLPVTLRNLEQEVPTRKAGPAVADANGGIPGKSRRLGQDDAEVITWLKKVRNAGQRRGEWIDAPDGTNRWRELTGADSIFEGQPDTAEFTLPKPLGAKAFEVIGIPLQQPGFHVVELASPRLGAALLGEARPRYVATAALVTNLSVHLKWGREASVVWVTTLDKASPVADAEVRVTSYCNGSLIWQGKTDDSGLARVPGGALPEPHDDSECDDANDTTPPLFVSARTNGDMSFALSSWSRGIQPTNFGLNSGSAYQAGTAHAVFDRTLLRAGETVSMKIYLRRRVMNGFAIPPADQAPDQLRIVHDASGQEYRLPIGFDALGIGTGTWTIPRDAKLGTYTAKLFRGDQWSYDAGDFQVQQFRIPTMRASIQPGPKPLINARAADVDVFVGYLNGGGAGGLPVRLRTQVQSKTLNYRDYADFAFGGQDYVEGVQPDTDSDDAVPEPTSRPATVLPLTLDGGGAARAAIADLPKLSEPHDLLTELEYQDANGERLTVAQRIPLWTASVNLGLRTEGWVASREQLRFQVLALDLSGKPAVGQDVHVDLLRRTTYSYRKRLIGGFYAYEDRAEIARLNVGCEGRTDTNGVLACELKPGISGDVIVRATTTDTQGNLARATQDVWIESGDDWWFAGGAGDRMDLLSERKAYEHGETAKFQVRSPFRDATALVTVEREGVLDAFVVPLKGTRPVVEVPIKDHFTPNVYVSVLAVRGRPNEEYGWLKSLGRKLRILGPDDSVTALIDLNKPAFRLGLSRIDVGWAPNRLDVRVTPERESYKVRDHARVNVNVRRADGAPLPAGTEIAFAAVDEGLLELKPNASWNLLDRMMGERGIEVNTATAQMQVVGKRHYGRKAVPHGGGGGRQQARELFDTLLLWQARITLPANGETSIDVPLNDSLTAFRLTAVASAGADRFGSGASTIRTTQDLMTLSGLPPLVREGDQFDAVFTLRNGADRPLSIHAEPHIGIEPSSLQAPALAAQALTLQPGEARETSWRIEVPAGAQRLDWEFGAQEDQPGNASDRLKLSQTVIPAVPVRVQQATLAQLAQPIRMAIERPADALPGRGGVRLLLAARLGDDGTGVRDYMRGYPYSCLEQRVSKAVALRDRSLWDETMAQLPNYLDGDGLYKYFPTDSLHGSDTLTAYVLATGHEANWPLPDGARTRGIDALKAFVAAKVARGSPLPTADLALRKLSAIEALSRFGAANADMLGSITIAPNLWPTSAVLDWLGILKRVETIPNRAARHQEAEQILRSRLTFRGSTMGFSSEDNDRLWWLMTSIDSNAVRTIALLADEPAWRSDLPRLVSGAIGRQSRGHWDTTLANAWGTLAMEKFNASFQAQPVAGKTAATLGLTRQSADWAPETRQAELDLDWPDRETWLELDHQGSGAPWVTIQSRAAIPLTRPDFNGYSIKRTIVPVEQRKAGTWSRGDVARIRLEVDAQADMTWVVVDDPVPAGATILGGGLGRDSSLLTAGERSEQRVWPIYVERRFEAFRAYYDYVPKGPWTIEYTVRLNNPGRFSLPPTRVEALYAPEVKGEWPNEPIDINGDS